MKEYNIWETNFKEDYEYFNNIDEFFKQLENKNNQYNIEIKNSYNPSQNPTSLLEEKAQQENIIINYTNENHQVLIQKDGIIYENQIIISPKIYEKNKKQIIEQLRKITEKQIEKKDYITIDEFFFTEYLLDKAIENKKTIYLKNVKLTEEQLSKIKNSFLNVYLVIDNQEYQISKMNLINGYSKERLENENEIIINSEIEDEDLKYIAFIKNYATIKMVNDSKNIDDYYKQVFKILDELERQNKNVKIKFKIEKRIDFKKYISLLQKYQNQNIEIDIDLQKYTISEYIEENNKLESLIESTKKSDMSPLEKYLTVYNIVKKFKPYTENNQNKDESRYIKYILNNDYIVCVGYSVLLIELLSRIGIEATEYSTIIKEVNENSQVETLGGHARTIVNLKDAKYGIDGYFIADATWDNHKNIDDTYNYALRPFNSMQKTDKLFSLEELDYILDNNDFNSFCTKINILLNKKLNEGKELLESYSFVFHEIIELLHELDSQEYEKLKKYINVEEDDRTEKFYEEFLTEVGHHIVNKSNKEINKEILAQAASTAKFYYEDIPDAFKLAYEDKIKREYKDYTYEIPDNDIYNQELKENEIKGRHI